MAKLFAAPAVSSLRVSTFKGLDVSTPDDQIALYRAADSLNMIPDASGEVRKRPGIQQLEGESLSGVGGKVLEVYPKRLVVSETKVTTDDGTWNFALYRYDAERWIATTYTKKKPTIVPYGNKLIAFMTEGAFADVNGAFCEAQANEVSDDLRCAVGILDGKEFHIYTSDSVKVVYGNEQERLKGWTAEDKYMPAPTIIINGDPAGAGSPHEQINLLTPWVTESFCVTNEEGDHTFYLNGLADCGITVGRANGNTAAMMNWFTVMVRVLNESNADNDSADWKVRYSKEVNCAGDGYRPELNRIFFDRTKNKEFYGATSDCNILPSYKEGEDNVRITYRRRDFREGFAAVCHSMCGGVYGVGGYKDRLFIGGSDLENGKNVVYYSEMDQPLYIGALNYIHAEQGTEVLALNGTGGTLAVLTDRGVSLVSGQVSEGNQESFVTDSIYTISTTIPAPKPIGYNNTATFGGEIVYLSEDGVIAIAAKDNYDERYAQHRSAMIDRKMLADKPWKILNYGRYLLIICADGYCWLLDENQPSNAGDQPYSSHQYEGFRMSGFSFDAFYVEDSQLKMVGDFRQILYWTDGAEATDYSDNGPKAIPAFWETPWIYGSNFYRKKRFSRLALLLGEANLGDYQIKVEGKKNDETEWSTIWDYDGTFCTFDYDRLNYGLFTYRTIHACPDIVRKIKIKKALRFKLKFSNDMINQSFVLREFGLDYVLGG